MNTIRSLDRAPTFQSAPAASLLSSHVGRSGFDSVKVETIRTAIAAGRYAIDPRQIAAGLLADAKASAALGLPGA